MSEKKTEEKEGKKYEGGDIPKVPKKEADEVRKEAEEKEPSSK